MHIRGKQESEAKLLKPLPKLRLGQMDGCAQRLQQIETAKAAAGSAVAMLQHRQTHGRQQHGSQRAGVEACQTAAPRATQVYAALAEQGVGLKGCVLAQLANKRRQRKWLLQAERQGHQQHQLLVLVQAV